MRVNAKSVTPTPPMRDAVDQMSDLAFKPEGQQDQTAQEAGPKPELGRDALDSIVKKMNETVKIFNRALEFQVADSGRVVIKVINEDTGEVVRQIPPEQMLDMFDKLDKMLGLLLDRKV